MKAQELRIGNWVNIGYDKQWDLDDFANYFGDWKGNENDAVEPIHLTSEILEKCGFVHNKSKVYNHNQWIELDLDGDGYNVFIKQKNTDNTCDCILLFHPLEYLHQLQNLYFYLSGEELEVNL